MDNNIEAIPGGAVIDSFQKLVECPVIKEQSNKQEKISSLANSDGFSALQEVIDSFIKDLKDIPIDPKKDDVNSIGFRYLASRVAIEYLESIRDMPDRFAKILKKDEK